ncbi:hypothetical protein CPU12_01270 [Malaciobacter molluscorum LMG 25693]|uniref:Uncharacterized protein n=1 Tax=Malaciobacter molluscorum LMG 25693 TaxID=870501 RepID=A0A2G1DLQ8_9BACT|nr:hypothetical protein [Malaciobacter molluscorum]AXX92210.1 hypothetical protein AMOL_1229 [Malaciobacter molluscorum LMG 25693]PHO19438.1 hypothetical protein CPU12_01270 [Malaciobacter molluscorum LMG 25693]
MKLKINKPKTRPIQIEPWFFRYLNEGELKVVSAILAHADIRNRQENSFPSNRTIAFYCGFGLLKENTKTHKIYLQLTKKEKEEFDKKRTKNAIQQVKNIKRALENKGVLKREYSGFKGKTIVYMTLDLEWKKEQFLKDYDEYFNDIEHEDNLEEKAQIEKELETIQNLYKKGDISKENMSKRLIDLSRRLKDIGEPEIPLDDVTKVADFYMNSKDIQNKINNDEIKNKDAYRNSIIKSIKNNEFKNANKLYKALEKEEYENILKILSEYYLNDKNDLPFSNKIYYFKKIRLEDNVFIARYKTKDNKFIKEVAIKNSEISYQLNNPITYTQRTRELLENYSKNEIKLIDKYKKKKE